MKKMIRSFVLSAKTHSSKSSNIDNTSLEQDYDVRIIHARSLVPEIMNICPFLELNEEDDKVICSVCQNKEAAMH